MKESGTGQARPGSCFCRSKEATGMTMMETKKLKNDDDDA